LDSLNGNLFYIILSFMLWGAGGWLISGYAFDLHQNERTLVGFSLGLVINNWLVDILAQCLPLTYALWIAPVFIFLSGVGVARPWIKEHLPPLPSVTETIIFGGLTYVFTAIGRGLAIFDEFQTIPAVSTIAAGNLPLRFMLNPGLSFDYHYFLLLFAAQLVRLGAIFPWTALDIARSITMTLTLMLTFLFAWRLTQNRIISLLSGFFVAFATGTRWLLALFPASILNYISTHIVMTGSGADSGATLSQALANPWVLAGSGSVPFPFAFADGISHPVILAMNGIGPLALMVLILLVLIADRRLNIVGTALTAIIVASLALANEVSFGLLYLGFLLAVLAAAIQRRSARTLPGFLPWLVILSIAGALALVEGGLFTGAVRHLLQHNMPNEQQAYYSLTFEPVFPPALVTLHFGTLSLGDPIQLMVALFEIGPVILILPLVLLAGIDALSNERWFEAGLIGSSVLGLGALFVIYTGSAGETSTVRMIEHTLWILRLYAFPLAWLWVSRRSERWKIIALAAGQITMLGGIIHFGVGLASASKPTFTYFVSDMDAKMTAAYWDQLPPSAIIFDPYPVRAPTVFGRFTNGWQQWGAPTDEWNALADAPDPFKLNAAGFDYIYFDQPYWDGLDKESQDSFSAVCVKLVREVEGVRGVNERKDFRRLLDIRDCK
jgi:hypothetical protein